MTGQWLNESQSPPGISKGYTADFTRRFILSNTFAVMRCARGSGPFGDV